MKFKIIILITCLLLLNLGFVRAEDLLGISLNCFSEDCSNQKIDYNQNVMLKLTIVNDKDYWIVIGDQKDEYGSLLLRLKVENRNVPKEKSEVLYYNIVGREAYIKPKSKLEVFLPLSPYNTLEKDSRLDDWKIYPQLEFSWQKVHLFDSSYKPVSYSGSQQAYSYATITGNALEFKAVKPEVFVPSGSLVIPKTFWQGQLFYWLMYIVAGIIIIVVAAIVVSKITKKSRRKKK